MTKNDVIDQLYNLSHNFNGLVNVPKEWLKGYVDRVFNEKRNCLFMIISLPDGDWLCQIYKDKFGWDYEIPDTREQESMLWNLFIGTT